jgi:hypothetical protein
MVRALLLFDFRIAIAIRVWSLWVGWDRSMSPQE